jgi:hypothetical protein
MIAALHAPKIIFYTHIIVIAAINIPILLVAIITVPNKTLEPLLFLLLFLQLLSHVSAAV